MRGEIYRINYRLKQLPPRTQAEYREVDCYLLERQLGESLVDVAYLLP